MLSRNPATHGQIPTGCGRSDQSALQGRDEERAFRSEQGTVLRKEERQQHRHSLTGRQRTSGGKERGLARGAKGNSRTPLQGIAQAQILPVDAFRAFGLFEGGSAATPHSAGKFGAVRRSVTETGGWDG